MRERAHWRADCRRRGSSSGGSHRYRSYSGWASFSASDRGSAHGSTASDDAFARGADAARGEEPGVSSKRRKAADGGVLDGGDDCVKSLDLSDFFRTTSGKFRTAPARAVADELTRQRDLRRGEGLS